ncbi:complement factor H-related protein 2-like [Menidia menidia]
MHLIFHSCVFFLWMQTLTFVRACTVEGFLTSRFYDSNFDTTGLEASYADGAHVRVPCIVGYGGFFKMICTDNGWSPTPGSSKCRPKSCGHPGEAQFADVRLEMGDDFVFGSQVVYTCREGYQMVSGTSRRSCTANGWDGEVPVCESIECNKPHVENAQITPERNSYGNRDTVRIDCPNGGKTFEMTCQRGAWMQSCGGSDCSSPPLLDNGDIKDSLKQKYKHDETVEYSCQAWYKMEGGPFRKCVNGEWTGEITCLKPCTVNQEDITANNIRLISGYDKMYSTHGDHITFQCTGGKSRVGSEALRQMCKDGVITLPRCE